MLHITFISDFICPWCLVGHARLDKALAALPPGIGIERTWLPFELNPHMPEEGLARRDYRIQKFGSLEYSMELDAQVNRAARYEGMEFRYDLMERTPNTRKAHRLTWLAGKAGLADGLAERILRGYFLEGKDIGDTGTLAALAGESGLDPAKATAFLATDEGVEDVLALERATIQRGVRSVPHILIGGQEISGAQPVEVFAAALRSALTGGEPTQLF